VATCVQCGEANPEGFRFCGTCGAPLDAQTRARSEERKLVTVVFADVIGSTALGERLDAEQLKEVMEAWFAAMRGEIEAEGGSVEKFIGDAVMAAFGVPAAHEDDASRALRAALRMRRRLEELNLELQASHGVRLELRMGVNTGEVMAATAPRPGEAMATGDAVNAAARLQQAAEPGQILVAERTARASRGIHFREIGPLSLRGKGEGIRAYSLLGEHATAERGIPGLRAPMVGRERERALLRSLYERVSAESTPHLVTIYGDAGVGKSRLLAEFLESARAATPQARVVRGRCLPYGEGITYWPLAEILKSIAGVLDSDSPDVALDKIRTAGVQISLPGPAEEAERAISALAYTVGLDDPRIAFRELPPRQVRAETHAAWRLFFSSLSAAEPLLIVVEDIHWAEAQLLDLLEELADRVQGPALFLCSSRPELTGQRPSWGGGRRNFSSVFLEPLSAQDTDRLMSLLLDIDDLPVALRERVLERAEGNPFFLEEIIRKLLDEGRIVHGDAGWRVVGDLGDFDLPDTVQAVLAARIDLLDAPDKEVLQQAAVVGRIFWNGSVAALLNGAGSDLDEALRRLEERDFVLARLASSISGQEEFIFKHILTRNVAYETLPRRSRGVAHANVAAWIETQSGERRGELVELLAHHYSEAHESLQRDARSDPDWVEQLRQQAFEHSLGAAADATSKMVLEKARRLAEHAVSLAVGPLERARALDALGTAYNLEFMGDEGWSYLCQAVDTRMEGVADDRMAIADLCGRALEIPVRWTGTMRRIPAEEEARRYLEIGFLHLDRGDSEARVRLLAAKGFWAHGFPAAVRTDQEHDEFHQAAQAAADMALGLGLTELALTALDAVQAGYLARGLHREELQVAERRRDLTETIRDPWELGDTFAMLANAYYHLGRFTEAAGAAGRGFELVLDEIPLVALHCLSHRAAARFRMGNWVGAFDDLKRAEEILGPGRDPVRGAALPWAIAAVIHEIRGETAAADRSIELTFRVEEGLSYGARNLSPWVVRFLMRRGELDRARARLDEALSLPHYESAAEIRQANCELIAQTSAWEQTDEVVGRARREAERGGSPMLEHAADRLEGAAALAGGDVETAQRMLGRALGGFSLREATWECAETALLLAEALHEAGDDHEASRHSEAAAETFDRLGAADELSRAHELARSTRS
jgi:class 3 adenylate cyclase/tetratricopeptide (TPR) repeat protein